MTMGTTATLDAPTSDTAGEPQTWEEGRRPTAADFGLVRVRLEPVETKRRLRSRRAATLPTAPVSAPRPTLVAPKPAAATKPVEPIAPIAPIEPVVPVEVVVETVSAPTADLVEMPLEPTSNPTPSQPGPAAPVVRSSRPSLPGVSDVAGGVSSVVGGARSLVGRTVGGTLSRVTGTAAAFETVMEPEAVAPAPVEIVIGPVEEVEDVVVAPVEVKPEPTPLTKPAGTPVTPKTPRTGTPYTVVRRRVAPTLAAAAVAVAAAAGCALVATGDQPQDHAAEIGVLAVVALAGLVTASRIRRKASSLTLAEDGRLTMALRGSQYRFDLATPTVQLEQSGQPGQRGWKVEIARRSMTSLRIDGRMVDPQAFMTALRQWRTQV